MNINQLRYFVAVAETRSFSKAANLYYISQTAITQQIHSLELSMNVQLIDRSCRPIQLTPAGNVFLMEAKGILDRIDAAVSKVQGASAGLVGTLRIGYTKGYERSSLSNQLKEFHLEYPNILITCFRADTDRLAAGLLNDDYDIIFTWDSTNLIQEPFVEHRTVEHVPLVVALYGSHPLARRPFLRRQELRNEPILYMSPSGVVDSFGDNHVMELYNKAGYHPDILFRSTDAESILIMVAAEEGISILPSYVTSKLTNADNLVFVPLLGTEESEAIVAVWKKTESGLPLRYFVSKCLGGPSIPG